jgi:hypothetical protein
VDARAILERLGIPTEPSRTAPARDPTELLGEMLVE